LDFYGRYPDDFAEKPNGKVLTFFMAASFRICIRLYFIDIQTHYLYLPRGNFYKSIPAEAAREAVRKEH